MIEVALVEAENVARHGLFAFAALDFDVFAAVLKVQVELLDSRELKLAFNAGAGLRTLGLDVRVQVKQVVDAVRI